MELPSLLRSKRIAVFLIFSLLSLCALVFVFGYTLENWIKKEEVPIQPPPAQTTPRRLGWKLPIELDESTFTPKQYIVALGDRLEGMPYSPKAQIRGVVDSWGSDKLKVRVGVNVVEVALPSRLQFLCLPLTLTDSQGKTYDPSEVFLDFRNLKEKGNTVDSVNLKEKLPVNEEIAIQVDIDMNGKIEAGFIVGFGCKI